MAESKPTMDTNKIDVDSQAVKVICLGDSAVGKSKLVKTDTIMILTTRDVCISINCFLPFYLLESDPSNYM